MFDAQPPIFAVKSHDIPISCSTILSNLVKSWFYMVKTCKIWRNIAFFQACKCAPLWWAGFCTCSFSPACHGSGTQSCHKALGDVRSAWIDPLLSKKSVGRMQAAIFIIYYLYDIMWYMIYINIYWYVMYVHRGVCVCVRVSTVRGKILIYDCT